MAARTKRVPSTALGRCPCWLEQTAKVGGRLSLTAITTAKRRARRNRKQTEIEQATEAFCDDNIHLYHCRFQDLKDLAGIERGSVVLVATDILYDKHFLPQVSDLAEMASWMLGDGRLLIMMTGQLYTDEVERRLRDHLTRQTPGIMVWDARKVGGGARRYRLRSHIPIRVRIVVQILQQAGIITYDHSHLTILNRRALEKVSCECYGASTAVYHCLMEGT